MIAICIHGPTALNRIVDYIITVLSILLPFAVTPLAQLVTSQSYC